jgi:hypothetical protein
MWRLTALLLASRLTGAQCNLSLITNLRGRKLRYFAAST